MYLMGHIMLYYDTVVIHTCHGVPIFLKKERKQTFNAKSKK